VYAEVEVGGRCYVYCFKRRYDKGLAGLHEALVLIHHAASNLSPEYFTTKEGQEKWDVFYDHLPRETWEQDLKDFWHWHANPRIELHDPWNLP
jgi:hypothetical protein